MYMSVLVRMRKRAQSKIKTGKAEISVRDVRGQRRDARLEGHLTGDAAHSSAAEVLQSLTGSVVLQAKAGHWGD